MDISDSLPNTQFIIFLIDHKSLQNIPLLHFRANLGIIKDLGKWTDLILCQIHSL